MTETAHTAASGPIVPVVAPTVIEFLLDETGSMQKYISETLGGFQDFVDEQRAVDGTCLFTLTKFDTRGLRTPYVDLDIGMVPYLTTQTYVPSSFTNLHDAIADRIEARTELLKTWDIEPRVLFVCMTDGADNSSQTPIHAVRSRIVSKTDSNWTFVYLGAYPKAADAAMKLGFLDGNVKCFQGARMRETMQDLSAATTAFRVAEKVSKTLYTDEERAVA